MHEIKVLAASDVSWGDYKNLRLKALREEPQAFEDSYTEESSTPDTLWQKRMERYREAKGNWMVFAKEAKKLVGMAGAFSPDGDKTTACIIAVFVAKEARGKGISKMLMTALLDQLAQSDMLTKVTLTVNIGQQAAVHLYKSCGFTIVAKDRAKRGDGNEYDEYKMEREV